MYGCKSSISCNHRSKPLLILKVVKTYKSDFLITVDGKEIFVRFLIQGKGAKRVVSA